MRAVEFVSEAFNQPYKTKSEKSEYGYDMLAKLPDGTNLSIMFSRVDIVDDIWGVEFYRNNSQEVTGEGDAQRIFATVLTAIQKFIKKYQPQTLFFTASKELDPSTYYGPDDVVPNPESRAKLYDRLVQRYAKAWGYRAFRADTGTLVRYELSRLSKDITESKTVEYEGLTLKISKNGHQLMVNALDDWGNKVLGHVTFNIGDGKELDPQDLKVDDKYQGQGIARVMYDYVKSLGYTIVRSYDQTDAGAGFWNKHRGEEVRVWEESNSTNVISAEKLWDYVSKIHPKDQRGGGFLKSLVMLNPQYELKRVPLTSLHIPDDEDEGNDPYGRAMFVDVDHAEEYSQYEVDKKPLVVDSQGYILDGAHRAWAASELLNKKDIMAYVPVKTRASTPQDLEIRKKFTKQGVAEDESNDTAISLSKLGKFHPGADTLAEFVPERATAQYALHPDKWESTFYSLTNKDSDKLKYYGPKKISIPPGTLVGDMAIANKFYRAKTPEEQEQYAELYKASLQPYPVDVSEYRMPELLIPKQGVAEGKITLSTDPNWYGATVDNYQASGPVVNIPANQLVGFEPDDKMNQPKSKANVEKIVAGLKKGDKLPPLLVRKYKKGYQVLDGHHRFWAYKLSGTKSIPVQIVPAKDIEEISKQGVAEGQDDNGISFQIQKGKNKFATTLSIGNNSVGVYQYDANTGRSIAEVYPEFKGKGLGKLLVLHAIYTAAKLGLDFQEDESRTSEYDNVLDSLSGSGYIVDDEGYWYVTGEGEQFLKQSLKQGVAGGASDNIPTMGINVRSDGDIDYASLIVDGEKKYESRKTDSLRPYVGKIVGIVRTGNGPAVAIGQVTIGEPIIVDAEKFNRFRKQHLVPQGSKFDIDSDGTKYLYPMIDPVRWDNEKPIKHRGIVSRKIQEQGVAEGEDKSKDLIANAILDFYQHVGKIHKDPIDDYVSTAKEMLGHVDDPTLKSKLLDIFKQAKQNPYVQGGVVTTIGALLAGGVLSSAQKMGLNPAQTNLALQAILNTVIPTVVSRINGKSWSDTIKYTLASAGIGTGIAGMMEE